ncbi:flavin-dependent monooxygenase [Breoghania sp.]|uniref:flavin-dependent monooxygenase n=1 Tax=Breoghania sp. TaxID=2065378 RepID=UPI00260D5EB1|nr:flavin-dependent monooxygenase [Breoghania sp.]MDJ0933107.1 flavin-dependent monooxygenase [Breoghania sp.]
MDNSVLTKEVDPVTALSAVLEEIRDRRDEFEKLTYVPLDMVEKLQVVGAYRAFVPKAFGGDEKSRWSFSNSSKPPRPPMPPPAGLRVSASLPPNLAALPSAMFEAIYGDNPDTVFAGAIFPSQQADAIPGGFKITGRWPYCSGCMGASLIGAGIKVNESGTSGLPRMAVMPRSDISIKHTWDTVGLTAIGSHDIVADGIVVPEEWTFVRGAPAQRDEPVFCYPAMTLAAQVLAVVGLGTACEALDWVKAQALEMPSITGASTLGARAYVQSEYAVADARLRSARAFFYEATESAWQTLLKGDAVQKDEIVRLRMAASHAANEGAAVAQMAFRIAGTRALTRGHVLNRCLMGANAVAQHAFLDLGTWMSAGAAMFAQLTPPGYP